MRKSKRRRKDYHPVRALYLAPDRCGRDVIKLMNQLAKAQGIPVQQAVPSFLREMLPDRIARLQEHVNRKVG